MISFYDYGIIAFYFLFVIGIGVVFKNLSKSTSDYFRAGGAMPWWITGTSAWIAGFSAWTFTGAAGKVYETGTLVLVLYYGNLVGLAMVLGFTCLRFRRMRVVTWMEAVRQRYGSSTERFYTAVKIPITMLLSGLGLNAVGVFMASTLHLEMSTVLIGLGATITVVALFGGAWAILASDFVQMFLVMTITIIVAVLTLKRPEIGGLGNLLAHVPKSHFNWTDLCQGPIIAVWSVAIIWQGFVTANNLEGATMYLMPKSDRDARRMALIPLFGSIVGPLIWFIPSMAATITHPDLHAQFPQIRNPHEAAFVASALDVLPKGLVGLLISAMLGATLTSMDAGLNKSVGVFVRSFLHPVVRPSATEKELLVYSKVATLIFGIIIIAFAVLVDRFRTMPLFDLTNQIAGNLGAPLAVPLLWGLFFKRTPAWSAWTTVIIGLAISFAINRFVTPGTLPVIVSRFNPLHVDVSHWSPSYITSHPDAKATFTREATDLIFFITVAGIVVISSAWYFFTSLFYRRSPVEYREQVDRFFENMSIPIDTVKEGLANYDEAIYRLLGNLCVVYGAVILAMTLIPNPLVGRVCFIFCGGSILTAGLILTGLAKRKRLATAFEATSLRIPSSDAVHKDTPVAT